jgi:hypothetical protein
LDTVVVVGESPYSILGACGETGGTGLKVGGIKSTSSAVIVGAFVGCIVSSELPMVHAHDSWSM